jgi:hypothetical protein
VRRLHWTKVTIAAVLPGFLHWCAHVPAADSADSDTPANETFFNGDYLLIGQEGEDGAPYKGRAHLEALGRHKIRLTRTISGVTTVEEGVFLGHNSDNERTTPSPKFTWEDARGAGEMFCYVTPNFDNYPLLMCIRDYPQEPKKTPGLESYFPAAIYSVQPD